MPIKDFTYTLLFLFAAELFGYNQGTKVMYTYDTLENINNIGRAKVDYILSFAYCFSKQFILTHLKLNLHRES